MNRKRCFIIFLSLVNAFVIYSQDAIINNINTDNGLPSNHITQIAFDNKEYMWIGSQNGLSVYDGQSFKQIEHPKLHPRISHIIKSNNDNKDTYFVSNSLVFKASYQPLSIKLTDKDFRNYTIQISSHNRHNGKKNSSSLFSYKEISGFASEDSLAKYYDNSNENYQEIYTVDSNIIIYIDPTEYKLFKNKSEQISLKSDLPFDLQQNGVVFTTDEDTYCLYNNTIFKLFIENNTLKKLAILNNILLDKKNDHLTSGEYNRYNKSFYFSSTHNGIYQVSPKVFSTNKIETKSKNFNKPIRGYYSQTEFAEDSIIIGNYIYVYPDGTTNRDNSIWESAIALNFLDSKKNLWLNNKTQLIIKNKDLHQTIDFGANFNVLKRNIIEFSDNTIYLLTQESLFIINNFKITEEIKLSDIGISYNEKSSQIFKSSNNQLYILTTDNLYLLNNESKKISKVLIPPKSLYRSITELKPNIYFIGSYSNGYAILYNDEFHDMPIDRQTNLKYAHTLLSDKQGHIWISTNNGLVRTRYLDLIAYIQEKTQNIYYYYYDKSSGFPSNEFNGGYQNTAIELSNGKFSFSTLKGLVSFFPEDVPALFPSSEIMINKLSANKSVLDNFGAEWKFPKDTKKIEIEVGLPYFGNADNLVLEYRIADSKLNWQDISETKRITIDNLPNGKYDLVIRKRIGFGAEEFEYKTIPFVIRSYFYQTAMFKLLMCLLILSLFYILNQWYYRYTIDRTKKLDQKVKERTIDLQLSNKNLVNQIKQNDLLKSILVHDIKSPIKFIKSNSELLRLHWDELDNELILNNLHHIQDASANIGYFIEETLLWIELQKGELNINSHEFKVLPLIKKVIDLYKTDSNILNNNIQIEIRCNHELHWKGDTHLLATILRNLLSNSIKYTKKGKITLFASKSIENKLTIGCSDTGIGMPPPLIDQLLSYEYHGITIRNDSFRIGFMLIKSIVNTLNGQLSISSEINKGTTISIDL